MTEVLLKLPDDLARRARAAGLLSDAAIQQMLEDTIRREAAHKLMVLAEQLRQSCIEPMSDDAILAEIQAVRAARSRAVMCRS